MSNIGTNPYMMMGQMFGGGGTGGGGGFDIMKLLGGALGSPLGLGAVSQLFGLISGPSWQEKMSKQGANNLKGMLGKDVFNTQKYIAGANRMMIPQVNQYGTAINKRFGLDQGRGQEAFLDKFFELQDANVFQGNYQNDLLKSQRDLAINQTLASLGSR